MIKIPEIFLSKGHNIYNIDSSYNKVSPKDKQYIYIPIIGTNDIHGKFFPSINQFYSNNEYIEYKTGGLENIAKYISILKNEFGSNRVLYFDSGDQFCCTEETILFNGKNILEFFNEIGLNGATLGNIDYIYKRSWIENIIKTAKYPYLINNIMDISSNKTKGALGNNQEQSHIYEIKLNEKEIIKIGAIGLTMNVGVDKPYKNLGNRQTWKNISFQDYYNNLEKESRKLRLKGANAIILITHIGLSCVNKKETNKLNLYSKYTKQSKFKCNNSSLLYKFIQNLNYGIVDAIIGGDTHINVHQWVNDIPIIITKGFSEYINILYLPFKKENNKFNLLNNDIKIEGPLPSCEKIFINLNHCEKIIGNNENLKDLKLKNYFWHNSKMEKEKITKPLFDKFYDLYNKALNNKVAKIIGFNKGLKIKRNGNCILSNMLMDIIRNITCTDFSVVNIGMFKNYYLTSNYLSIFDFIKIIPHEYYLCITTIKGKEIKKLIKIFLKTEKGFLYTSGLKIYIKNNYKSKKKELFEIKIYSYNDKNDKIVKIEDEKEYLLSSNNHFLSEINRRQLSPFLNNSSKYKKKEIKCSKIKAFIEIMNYFKNKGTMDINQLFNMKKKRIVFLDR